MAGRLPTTAGRRAPIRRALASSIAACAIGATTAAAADEWTVAPATQNGSEQVWQVAPAAGDTTSWTVSPTDPNAKPTARTAPSAESIFDRFVATSTVGITETGAQPPVAPTAIEVATPSAKLDPDNPDVKALAAAEEALDVIDADLADVRGQLESAGPDEYDALAAREAVLQEKSAAAASTVEERQAVVDKLQAEADKKAAAAALTPTNPFVTTPGLTYAPVSGTVPTIDANLASQLDGYLASQGSPLAGLGSVFVYQSTAVGLDPRLLVAISGAETSFGTYGPSQTIHNPFGMGPGIVYPTWADSIASAARNLGGSLYKGSGLVTIAQIQRRWAPNGAANDPTNLNSHWFKNVSKYYSALGGDPNGSVFTDRAASATAIPVAPGVAPGIQGTVAAPTAYGNPVTVPGGGKNVGPAAVQLAVKHVGAAYRVGGATPAGFDAPGLVRFVYAKQGVTLPATAVAQSRVGTAISPEQLSAGDVVFFADRVGHINHEGLYVGKGYFVHAPKAGDVVKISSLYEPYFATQYAGARRY